MGEGRAVPEGGGSLRAVWLGRALVAPERAGLAIDDPGVRFGEGLIETMRAEGGRVPLLDRHLDRLERSAAVLGLAPMPSREEVIAGVQAVVAAVGGRARVRVTATPAPTLLVEAVPLASGDAGDERGSTAVSLRGAWTGDPLAEHKTLSRAGLRRAERIARSATADDALLLDADGRLGEAAGANVYCVIGGEVITAPARGLLAGVARSLVLDLAQVREEPLSERDWRGADEIFATSAVRGIDAIVRVDGPPVGAGAPGPVTRRLRAAYRARVAAETGGGWLSSRLD